MLPFSTPPLGPERRANKLSQLLPVAVLTLAASGLRLGDYNAMRRTTK